MPPRFVKKNVGTTAQKKTAAKAPGQVRELYPTKLEPEAVETAEAKPSPTVETPNAEEKAVEVFQDLNEPSVEAEPDKEIPVEDANMENKESTKDADKRSAEGSEEDVGEGKDKEQQDEPAENNVVIGEQSHGNEVAEGAGCREEGVEGDGGDDQRDVEMPAMVKERIKQKEFEVFVGGLDKDAGEEDLKKLFSEVGEVVEIILPKYPLFEKNRGFGFVRFAAVEQAKKAVAELKNPQVRGKHCRVTRSQGNETLYVRNICKSWTKEAVRKKLTEYGIDNIEEITLREDPQEDGTNRGFAFLEFPTHLEAANAFKSLRQREVFFGIDQCAKVAFPKSRIEPDEEVMAQVKSIFVDGLPPSWDEEKVREQFKSYGEIEQVQLARNMPTAKRKDFGFIYFTTREAAVACIEGVNKNELNGEDNNVTLKATLQRSQQKGRSGMQRDVFFGIDQCAKVAFAKSRIKPDEQVMAQVKSIFVSGLPPSWDEKRIQEKFQAYGEIEQVQLARNIPTARRKDFGFIYFTTREAAVACIEGVNKNELNEEDNNVTLKAALQRPQQKGRSVRAGYGGRRGSRVRNERREPSGKSGSKRPYSDVDDDLPYPGRHSRSRLDYDAAAADNVMEE